MDEENPVLKQTIMDIVRNQLRDNEPPEARQTLNRLLMQGISQEDSEIYIGQAICIEI